MSVLVIKDEKLHRDIAYLADKQGKKLYALAEEAVRDLLKKYEEESK